VPAADRTHLYALLGALKANLRVPDDAKRTA
jgi:hypothetical protein